MLDTEGEEDCRSLTKRNCEDWKLKAEVNFHLGVRGGGVGFLGGGVQHAS